MEYKNSSSTLAAGKWHAWFSYRYYVDVRVRRASPFTKSIFKKDEEQI